MHDEERSGRPSMHIAETVPEVNQKLDNEYCPKKSRVSEIVCNVGTGNAHQPTQRAKMSRGRAFLYR